jgi:phage gp16-like protein
MNRARLYAMIHLAIKRLGWDDATYRAWLEKHTGRRSCSDCSDGQLSLAADLLRDLGALEQPAPLPVGGSGPDRPTQAQLRAVKSAAKKCGLSGAFNDPGLLTLCRRVAKVDNIRFLDRHGVSVLINALDGWAASKAKRRKAGTSQYAGENSPT